MKQLKKIESSDNSVWKYVFEFSNNAIAECVLYRYKSFKDRTVLCVSVQSGCPVGCKFCGTGEQFIRNLSASEILDQVLYIFKDKKIDTENCEKLQIMFMSMGEPFLNYNNVQHAITHLNMLYPNAELLVSTIAPNSVHYDKFINLSKMIPKIGLQFSIHKSNDEERNELIPFESKLTLEEIRDYGTQWFIETGRKPYLNYCVNGENSNEEDFIRLWRLFRPEVFCLTFSVICSADENMKEKAYRDLEKIEAFRELFVENGYDTRVFDPAGQDDIGGGCGQLWFVQQYMNKMKKEIEPSPLTRENVKKLFKYIDETIEKASI